MQVNIYQNPYRNGHLQPNHKCRLLKWLILIEIHGNWCLLTLKLVRSGPTDPLIELNCDEIGVIMSAKPLC